uniref:CXADR-like membrane protein-like n=1 Tax=Neolamprologus brichardi TaxID=32507 RepID=A0A3Q4HJW1_NEOBR
LVSLLSVGAQTEMKKVVGDNATLPCHHQFSSSVPLDIEWLLQKPNSPQKIITFFGGNVYISDPMDTEPNHLSFAGEYLGGDASLLISDLLLSDTGEYYCKVKSGGKYHWSQVNLIVLKPSKPRCRMDGKLQEGSDVKLSCKSSDGSDPISYKWERVLDKGKSLGKLPNLALILKNPEIVTLRNLTMDSTGVYRCTASNDVGEENCTIEVTIKEDAEAPKAKLVKPNSLSSSRSGSSRSGASSTQSMVHNTAQRGHRPRPPAVAALKENGHPPGFPQSPPSYTTVVPPKTTEPPATPKFNSRNMSAPTPPTLMVPAQTKAFQTV